MSTTIADLGLTVRRTGNAHTVEPRITLPDSTAPELIDGVQGRRLLREGLDAVFRVVEHKR